jgi:hypothetical protein
MKLEDQANDLAGCSGCYDGTFRRKRQRILNKIGRTAKGGKTSKQGYPLMPDWLARPA